MDMLVKFNEIKGMSVQGINNETDMMGCCGRTEKMISCFIHVDGSIGLYKHEISDDINYVLFRSRKKPFVMAERKF